ncbi:hypothetical protein RhiirB3_455669 [Rhizophagus irregularis]|nr:hypothetical protein RhiirB3_455669 [Rhizophagus irregularis]
MRYEHYRLYKVNLQEIKILVAIDFGTTHSSFAYMRKENSENIEFYKLDNLEERSRLIKLFKLHLFNLRKKELSPHYKYD